MTRTLLIPEVGGAPTDHWQAWWTEVERDAHMIHQAESPGQMHLAWASRIADAIPADPDTIVVAHGGSCAIVAKLLSSRAQPGVAAALFVAPASPNRNNDRVRLSGPSGEELPLPTTVVASRTDPWIDIDEAARLAEDWGSQFVDAGDAGHIDAQSGFGPWPGGIELRDELLIRARRYIWPRQVRDLPAQRWAF